MKISLIGITGVPLGTHRVKDPRLDQADKLVEAAKKVYAHVDVVAEGDALTADAIVASAEGRLELMIRDLELAETRLERNPPDAEKAVFLKIKACLEAEQVVSKAGLTPEEAQAVDAHAFFTTKPVIVADAPDVAEFDDFLVRVVSEAGYISFLTVAGRRTGRGWSGRARPRPSGGAIHTDIHKGFIRAEIIGFADFIAARGRPRRKREQAARRDQDLRDAGLRPCEFPLQQVTAGAPGALPPIASLSRGRLRTSGRAAG